MGNHRGRPGGHEMDENPIVIYRARTAAEAELVRGRLADRGIKALVTNDYAGGSGVAGRAAESQVVVGQSDADQARQVVEEFTRPQCQCCGQPEPTEPAAEIHEADWEWPICPDCDSQRTTTCPGCGRSGTDFPLGDCEPHAAAEAGAERATQVLICPTCDEPFVPKYLPRCEWCGHVFEPEAAVPEAVEPGQDESLDWRILAALATIVVLGGGVAAYLWWLFA